MFTRCPHCQSVHALNAQALSQDGGTVVCGHCKRKFAATEQLYDDYPESEQPSWFPAETPVLGSSGPDESANVALDDFLIDEPTGSNVKWIWRTLLALLVAVTLVNLAWTFRDTWLNAPAVQEFITKHDLPGAVSHAPWRDTARIHLVSRDIHKHPSRDGYLVLSATFVNLAEQAQPYPELALHLIDADNHALASRVFGPHEYLAMEVNGTTKLQPGTHVPVLIEFADPGEDAVGFELEFH